MVKAHIEICRILMHGKDELCNIDWDDAIDTGSNLSSSVFENILLTLGLDYGVFATKEKLIDEKLLGRRNAIAHGEYRPLSKEEYLEIEGMIMEIMERVRDEILNAATMESYRAS